MAGRDNNDDMPIAVQRALAREQRLASRPTQKELELAGRVAATHRSYAKAQSEANASNLDTLENRRSEYQSAQDRLQTYAMQQETLQSSRLRSAVYTATSPASINTDVAQFRSMRDVQREAYNLANRRGFDPERGLSRAARGLSAIHERMAMVAEDTDMPRVEREQELAELAKRAQRFTQRRATYEVAGQVMHRQGRDEEGIMRRAERAIGQYQRTATGVGIAENVAAGQYGTYKDLQLRQMEVGGQLQKAQADLAALTSQEVKKRKELLRTIDALTSETDKNAQVMAEMNRQGKTGGGGGGAMITRGMGALGQGLQMAGAVGHTYYDYSRFKNVGSELSLLDMRVGYAQLANRQYQDARAMGQGDMAAMMRIMGGAYGSAALTGSSLKQKEAEALTGGMWGTGVGAAGKIISGAAGGAVIGSAVPLLGTAAGIVGGGLAAGASSLGDIGGIAKTSLSLEKRIPQSQVDIEAQNKALQLFTEMNAPQAQQVQAYRDTVMSYAEALRGVGEGAFSIPQAGREDMINAPAPNMPGATGMRPLLKGNVQQSSIYGGAGARITEGYGKRIHPITGKPDDHRAIDVGAGGAQLAAPFSGTLRWYTSKAGGVTASITNEAGDFTIKAAHLSQMNISGLRQGQDYRVAAGEIFGTEGSTGASTGTHTHWSALKKGSGMFGFSSVDPREYLGEFNAMKTRGGVGSIAGDSGVSIARGGGRFEDTLNAAMSMRAAIASLGVGDQEGIQTFSGLKRAMGVNIGQPGGPGFSFAGTEAMMRAGQWSARGYLESPQQYAEMMGKMTNVGGGVKDLEGALKAAVIAGLDSSKNIEQMVSGIVNISAKAAITGMSVAPGATSAMMGVTAALDRAGIDKNLQVGAAQQVIQGMNQAGGGFDYDLQSIYGMQNAARSGIRDPKRAALYAGTSVTDFKAIEAAYKSGDMSGARRLAEQHGFEDKITGDSKATLDFLQQGIRGRKGAELIGTGAPIHSPKAWKAYEDAMRDGKPVPEWATKELGLGTAVAARGGMSVIGIQGYIGDSQYDPSRVQEAGDRVNKVQRTVTGSQAGGTVGGVGAAKAAPAEQAVFESEAGKKLAGDIKSLGPILQKAVEEIDWSKMAENASDAAAKLDTPIGNLGGTVSSLNTVLGQTVSRMENLVKAMDAKGIKGSNDPISKDATTQLDVLRRSREKVQP